MDDQKDTIQKFLVDALLSGKKSGSKVISRAKGTKIVALFKKICNDSASHLKLWVNTGEKIAFRTTLSTLGSVPSNVFTVDLGTLNTTDLTVDRVKPKVRNRIFFSVKVKVFTNVLRCAWSIGCALVANQEKGEH